MKWIIIKRKPESEFVFVCNSSVLADDADEATKFDTEGEAQAAMIKWGLSGLDYFTAQKAFSDFEEKDSK